MSTPLRLIFNEVAELYHRARPGCPEEVVDAVVALSGMSSGGTMVEVGCGTGQITLPFAQRGYRITALEPGDALAAVAARVLAPYPEVTIVQSTFERWRPGPARFDLLLAAQSFHWIEPETGVALATDAVRSGGSVALVWHVDRSRGTPFWNRSQSLYDRYFPKSGGKGVAGGIEGYRAALSASEQFAPLQEVRHRWSEVYTGERYIELLNTFSDHCSLPEPNRTRFFEEMAELIEEMGGSVERRYDSVALVARRV